MPVKGAGGLLGRRVLVAAALVLLCALTGPSFAAAEGFTVNTTTDETDVTPGDEYCKTLVDNCSLRAAIEEANELDGDDEIRFDEEVFEGDAESVIEPEPALPAIASTLTLAGRSCQRNSGVSGPCVEIAGDPDEVGLRVEGAKNVSIELVAVTGSEVGIELFDAPEFFVKSNWLGTSLDGSAAGNEIGIGVRPGSEDSRVGGEGEGTGNLISNNSAVGLELRGTSKVRVLGNRFGVTPAEDGPAPNRSNVVVASTAGSVALENTIGTRLSAEAAATSACDGGCNLISGSKGDGVDLDPGGELLPAVATTIAGNAIGFGSSGTGTIANDAAGIYVGDAPRTVVGGPKPGDANQFAGGTAAVEAGPGAPGLAVRGNLIGMRAGAVPPADGILVDSTSLLFPAEEASILENEIGLDGGTGIAQQGFAATISGNLVAGAETGIRVYNEAHGSLVEGNSVADTQGAALLLETNGNEVFANRLSGAGAAGIRVAGAPPFGVRGNLIGGATAASENTIDGSAGAAIEIEDVEESWNEVGRNRGSGNGGLFIDLLPAESGAGDPNDGIQPPPIAAISETGAGGFAEPGATVRVFGKASPAPGELESFLGEATADAEGNWSLVFPTSLPAGTNIAATQTLGGGTSQLSITAVPLPGGTSPPPPGAGPLGDRRPPRTRMLRQPRRVRVGATARFSFSANEAGSSFQCSLDRARFRPCKSPQKYRLTRPGKHLFRVRAIDPAGNVDATPVRRRFEVLD